MISTKIYFFACYTGHRAACMLHRPPCGIAGATPLALPRQDEPVSHPGLSQAGNGRATREKLPSGSADLALTCVLFQCPSFFASLLSTFIALPWFGGLGSAGLLATGLGL